MNKYELISCDREMSNCDGEICIETFEAENDIEAIKKIVEFYQDNANEKSEELDNAFEIYLQSNDKEDLENIFAVIGDEACEERLYDLDVHRIKNITTNQVLYDGTSNAKHIQ